MTATKIRVGQASRASGEAARRYVVAAAEAAIGRSIDAVVTLPMNKEAARLSDPEFVGHTELIAGLCGVTNFAMMLTLPSLATTYVSTHVSVAEAVKLVRRERVADLILLTNAALKRLMERPRIAVAGLNPHAGEGGMFGEEETREIRPAVEEARLRGVLVEGPLPPDTVFYQALRLGRFDAIVCMYHDQGHIPLKTLDFEGGVNVTLGLPIIRTSVDHGTAFEIAYKGKASTRSFVAALEYGAKLAGVRR
jgi:4-hydroxythreonine-4-phosphate dehydrogenase